MQTTLSTHLKNGVYILAGLLCCAAAYNLYLIPNDIAAGGFTGIGQLIHHRIPAISVGAVAFALNVPLFALSLRRLGFAFGLRSVMAMVGLSLLIDHLPLPSATDDMLLATVFGGVLGGIGFGLVLRGSATTGGTDMLASLIHRAFPFIRVSVGIFAVDGLVILASMFVFDQQAAMYALICAFMMNLMVDVVLQGPNAARAWWIVTDHADAIAEEIFKRLDRGATCFDAKGMYSGRKKQVLLCVVGRFETVQLRRIVFERDPGAFVITAQAHEVLGEGFADGETDKEKNVSKTQPEGD